MPDLNSVVTKVLQQRFDWWSEQDSLSLMIDLAGEGVSVSLGEYDDGVDEEHGIYVSYNHGPDCEGCQHIQTLMKGGTQ